MHIIHATVCGRNIKYLPTQINNQGTTCSPPTGKTNIWPEAPINRARRYVRAPKSLRGKCDPKDDLKNYDYAQAVYHTMLVALGEGAG